MMKTRCVLRRRTTMHRDVTGIVINNIRSRSVTGGHLAGDRTEVKWIEGDVVCLPALLFDCSNREVRSDSRQVGEALRQTPFSLPI